MTVENNDIKPLWLYTLSLELNPLKATYEYIDISSDTTKKLKTLRDRFANINNIGYSFDKLPELIANTGKLVSRYRYDIILCRIFSKSNSDYRYITANVISGLQVVSKATVINMGYNEKIDNIDMRVLDTSTVVTPGYIYNGLHTQDGIYRLTVTDFANIEDVNSHAIPCEAIDKVSELIQLNILKVSSNRYSSYTKDKPEEKINKDKLEDDGSIQVTNLNKLIDEFTQVLAEADSKLKTIPYPQYLRPGEEQGKSTWEKARVNKQYTYIIQLIYFEDNIRYYNTVTVNTDPFKVESKYIPIEKIEDVKLGDINIAELSYNNMPYAIMTTSGFIIEDTALSNNKLTVICKIRDLADDIVYLVAYPFGGLYILNNDEIVKCARSNSLLNLEYNDSNFGLVRTEISYKMTDNSIPVVSAADISNLSELCEVDSDEIRAERFKNMAKALNKPTFLKAAYY